MKGVLTVAVQNPYRQYFENAVMSAGPGELILMLYDGAVKYIRQGIMYIEEKNVERAHRAIVRAQDIVAYLMETLNMDYEIAKNLAALYDFIMDRLVQGNVKKDVKLLKEALELVEDLRGTWEQVLGRGDGQVAKTE